MAETIENNLRKLIIDEMDVNPQYYERMSQLLDELIEQRKREATDYKEYLKKIAELAKNVRHPGTGSSYPEGVTTPALQALFDNLKVASSNAEEPAPPYGYDTVEEYKTHTAIALDKTIKSVKKAGWRGNHFKEKQVKLAIKKVLGEDESMINHIFEIVKNQNDY